jgi:putative membrane protein
VIDFLVQHFNLVRGLHILAAIAFMAGMLYLPRLYVYHTKATPGSEMDETFKVMERRLLRGIINPASILTFVFGLA